MSSRVAFNAQLSSIMESVARFALSEVHRLVEQDSAELLKEVARLVEANSALEDKVSRLESELAAATGRDAPGYRSVAAQTKSDAVEGVCESVCDREISLAISSVCSLASVIERTVSSEQRESSPYSLERIPKKKIPDDVIVNQVNVDNDVELESVSAGEEHKGALEAEDSCVIITVEEADDASVLHEDSRDAVLNSVPDSPESFSSHVHPVEEEDDAPVLQEDSQDAVMDSAVGGSSQNLAKFEEALRSIQSVKPSDSNMSSRTPRSVYSCPVCNKTFHQRGALMQHAESHNFIYCSVCMKLVPLMNKDKHKCTSEGSAKVPSQPSLRVCDMCGKHFPSPSSLRMHQAIHTGERPHMCTVCGKRFTQKGNLKSHLRTHNGDKPFQCFICRMTFAHMKNLKGHMLTHDQHGVEERLINM